MMTAAVVSTDAASSSLLRASLQQTGLVGSVLEWQGAAPTGHQQEIMPDAVLLDIQSNSELMFGVASALRRKWPAIHIVACAPVVQPDPQLLMQAMRAGVQEFCPKPVDPVQLREILLRFLRERDTAPAHATDNLILVLGSKGGVGTTTITVNMAVQLAQATKKRVIILDFARPVGHLGVLLDLHPRFSLRDAITNLDHLDSHFFEGLITRHSSGVEVLTGSTDPEEWQGITPATLARIASVAQGVGDYVFIDGGVCGLAAWEPVFRITRTIVVVAEARLVSLWGLQQAVAAILALGVDRQHVRVLINRWRRVDEEPLSKIEKSIKHPIFARIPNDYVQVSQAESLGVPLSGNHNNSLVSKYRQLACQLAGVGHSSESKKGGLSGLLSFQSKKG